MNILFIMNERVFSQCNGGPKARSTNPCATLNMFILVIVNERVFSQLVNVMEDLFHDFRTSPINQESRAKRREAKDERELTSSSRHITARLCVCLSTCPSFSVSTAATCMHALAL